MELKFKWERKKGQYQNGEHCFLNEIIIGGFEWDASNGSKNGTPWIAYINLPGFKIPDALRSQQSEESAKKIIEKVATKWFVRVLA